MLTLFLSTTGCFVLMQGFGQVATGIRNVGHGERWHDPGIPGVKGI